MPISQQSNHVSIMLSKFANVVMRRSDLPRLVCHIACDLGSYLLRPTVIDEIIEGDEDPSGGVSGGVSSESGPLAGWGTFTAWFDVDDASEGSSLGPPMPLSRQSSRSGSASVLTTQQSPRGLSVATPSAGSAEASVDMGTSLVVHEGPVPLGSNFIVRMRLVVEDETPLSPSSPRAGNLSGLFVCGVDVPVPALIAASQADAPLEAIIPYTSRSDAKGMRMKDGLLLLYIHTCAPLCQVSSCEWPS